MSDLYYSIELISGCMFGIELAEDEMINYVIIDLGFIRININWDKNFNDN